MAKIKLDLDYNLKYPEGATPENLPQAFAELSRDYIEYAVSSHYKEGLNSQWRRVYSNIQKKIAEAISTKTFEVDFSEVEMSFLKMSFDSKDTKFSAALAQYVVTLEDEIFKPV